VSSAGPALPVKKHASNDSVPSGGGWMERLEAARSGGALGLAEVDAGPGAPPPPPAPGRAPTPVAAPAQDVAPQGGFQAKPAHLLIAELEEDERRRKAEARQRRAEQTEDPATMSIAEVEIDRPKEAPKPKALPTWVVVAALGLVAVGGAVVAYQVGYSEPAPETVVDAELQAALERRKKAIALLDEGATLQLQGKEKADAAIVAYNKALELEPSLGKAHRGLGGVYASKKDVANAILHYKKYLELTPDADDADQVRAIIEKHEDDPMRPKTRGK
jgi:tetratricopeptide (TPR) repeat protein